MNKRLTEGGVFVHTARMWGTRIANILIEFPIFHRTTIFSALLHYNMKLEKILDILNSFEKNAFIKIIDSIVANKPKNGKEIESLLSSSIRTGLKDADNVVIAKVFSLVEDEFSQLIRKEFVDTSSQLDILADIVSRDGNCIMKFIWFSGLYNAEIKQINNQIKKLQDDLENPKSEISEGRKRDYRVYLSCVKTAFTNDVKSNRESKITDDELSILLTLSKELEISQDAVKLINYMVVPVQKIEPETIINELRNIGVIFFSKKSNTIYVADEMVRILRKIRNKEVADKFFRRTLRTFKEPQINFVCKKHNIDWRLDYETKIKLIIKNGLSFSGVLCNDIHKENTSATEKKKFLNDLWNQSLGMTGNLKGGTIEEKMNAIIEYFESIEKDEKIGISIDGYDKLLTELGEDFKGLNKLLKTEFELEDENVLSSSLLLEYNIKPRDVLDIVSMQDLDAFCKLKDIKPRGNKLDNILEAYKDSQNLYLENYVEIGYRNLNALKESGINLKEADLGIKFEDLTKSIFVQLGFNVDEELRKKMNTSKDQIDVLINLGDNNLILVECKTIKESGYNKFSAVSRQMIAYKKLAMSNGYSIIKSLLVAPEFSDDFINDTNSEMELNLSLITAETLRSILEAFKTTKKHKELPYVLFMKDVVIQADRIIKAISK